MLAPFTVTVRLAGLSVTNVLVGVSVYVPFARLVKLKAPEEFVVTMPDDAPLSATSTPAPNELGLIAPETAHVVGVPPPGIVDAVKFTPVASLPFNTTALSVGLKVSELLLGITVYDPSASALKLKFPDPSVVTVAAVMDVALLVSVTCTLAPSELGLIVPEICRVGVPPPDAVAVKLTPDTLPPLTVTLRLAGLKVTDALVGVTV